MIRLFSMVKDECDIVREWIEYHGYLFGFDNLFIIDNMSTDGTFEIMKQFIDKGVHIYRENDYLQKGNLMKRLIDQNCKIGDIAFPLDIDEFIVYHERGTKDVSCDKNKINEYILNIGDVAPVYKANYLGSVITEEDGYLNAVRDNNWAIYLDYGFVAKAFFKVGLYSGTIDHGNHFGTDNYYMTNICLVHFHCRNVKQMKKKATNNIIGLGYPTDLDGLKKIFNPHMMGHQHVINKLSMLEGTYKIDVTPYNDTFISLENLNNFVKNK